MEEVQPELLISQTKASLSPTSGLMFPLYVVPIIRKTNLLFRNCHRFTDHENEENSGGV